jgi:hypothetical protein
MVPNGPDDFDKDPCDCLKERNEMPNVKKTYPSKSKPGKVYSIIEAADGSNYCDCWQWKRNKTCSHLQNYENGVGYFEATQGAGVSVPTTEQSVDDVSHVIDNVINRFAQ